ncbi:hypothetical protein BDV95DRAFT_597522 [Massariosphaeria phaeospora]|uniref:Uncharacterized protein n=1 Tax=Massariosphaeria phaeospora TaxID=100035 RepID=A0A7C8I915_9PLEO|nr:hypothetical protein BDV95DRAFT_597522 [Massariosphaeria phaeospora]
MLVHQPHTAIASSSRRHQWVPPPPSQQHGCEASDGRALHAAGTGAELFRRTFRGTGPNGTAMAPSYARVASRLDGHAPEFSRPLERTAKGRCLSCQECRANAFELCAAVCFMQSEWPSWRRSTGHLIRSPNVAASSTVLPLLVRVAARSLGVPPALLGLDVLFLFLTAALCAFLPSDCLGDSDGHPSTCIPWPVSCASRPAVGNPINDITASLWAPIVMEPFSPSVISTTNTGCQALWSQGPRAYDVDVLTWDAVSLVSRSKIGCVKKHEQAAFCIQPFTPVADDFSSRIIYPSLPDPMAALLELNATEPRTPNFSVSRLLSTIGVKYNRFTGRVKS